MLTIKVVYQAGDEFRKTYLFEASNPVHYSDAVKTYQEWCDIVKSLTDTYTIPCNYIMEYPKEEDFTGTTAFPFECLFYDNADGQLNLLLIRHAWVYIMNNGKTVDSISI